MNARILTRRKFFGFCGLAAAGSAIAACGATPVPAATATSAPAEQPSAAPTVSPTSEGAAEVPTATPVSPATAVPAAESGIELVSWSGWGAGNWQKAMEAHIDLPEFAELVPGVSKITAVGGKWTEQVLAALAGGEGFDVGYVFPYSELFARGAMLPLTEQINASTVIKKDDIPDANWKGCTYNGEVWGVPGLEGGPRAALIWNKGMFQEAGLDPEKPPVTWDEVYSYHETLTQFDDARNVKQMGLDPYDAEGGYYGGGDAFQIPASWGFKYFDEATNTYNIDNPDMVEAWKVFTSFITLIGPEKMGAFRASFGGWSDSNGSVAKGLQAMQLNGIWTPGALKNVAPDKSFGYTWIPVPQKRRGKRVLAAGGHFVIIPTISRYQDIAFKYAEFLTTSDAAADSLFKSDGFVSPRKSYIAKLDPSATPGLDWFIQATLDNDEYVPMVVDPVEGFGQSDWTKLREEVYFGRLTAEAAVKQFQDDCTKALQEMLEA